MTNRFTGKTALITGGGSGIGRAVARAFAAEGATAVVLGRTQDTLDETVALIRRDGGTAGSVRADVSREAEIKDAIDTIALRYRRLDIAFNNAGVLVPGKIADLDERAWSSALAVNLTGTWLSMKHEITYMRRNGGGVIVNTSSNIGAHLTRTGMGSYMATKAGVSAITRAAALEYIGEGIRINSISPGSSDTGMSKRPGETAEDSAERIRSTVPIGRMGSLDEIASAVLWLASPESGFTVGHDLVVDGGASA
ncbi:SDR family NAD(P)-dependent oxidoreductase [Arthrobacter sp. KNU40]|uniref:SDR family NAD(P)-dependent oxidoreductase n=1 Tax=Arthrobacter sp. KNU40 TaxID=3447965 RepID=UPI003F5D93B8